MLVVLVVVLAVVESAIVFFLPRGAVESSARVVVELVVFFVRLLGAGEQADIARVGASLVDEVFDSSGKDREAVGEVFVHR